MNNLVFKSDKGNPVTTSLLIAEKFEKNHSHVLRDIECLSCSNSFRESNFGRMFNIRKLPNGGFKKDPYYVMTKDGFTFLVMGYTGEKASRFKEDYINAFNEMENKIKELASSQFQIPQTFADALRLAADKAEENQKLQKTIEIQAPKVRFAESVEGAKTNITIGDMAKLICQNGVDIGQNRFYSWLVDNRYLIRRSRWSKKKQKNIYDYMPTQKAADLKIFHAKPTTISTSEGAYVKYSVKVNGKGQIYFMNKFFPSEKTTSNKQ